MTVLLPYGFTLFSNTKQTKSTETLVLLPYGFTLFSNTFPSTAYNNYVLLPYGFTLFSNYSLQTLQSFRFYYLMDLHYSQTHNRSAEKSHPVLLPYGFTLFSNSRDIASAFNSFYYLMDLHYSQTQGILQALLIRFTTLWIYTILKPLSDLRAAVGVLLPYGFTLFSNKIPRSSTFQKFYYLMDLHYSQTPPLSIAITTSFTTLWIYTILKHSTRTGTTADVLLPYGFTLFSNLK